MININFPNKNSHDTRTLKAVLVPMYSAIHKFFDLCVLYVIMR